MHTTKVIKNFIETELKKGVTVDASWHQDYKDSAYIFVGGLHFGMNEGDISTVFSQYGEIVDVRLFRDKKTGKSRGFCFVAYEDQRSTVLAVDNFNGAEICGRTIRVDHVKKFKPPKEFLEVKEGEEGNPDDIDDEDKIYKPSGPDGRGWGKYRNYTEEELELMKREEEKQNQTVEQMDNLYDKLQKTREKVLIDEDERWERMLMSRVEEEENQREKIRKEMLKKIKKEMKKRKKLENKEKDKKEKKEKKKKKKEKEGNEQGDNEEVDEQQFLEALSKLEAKQEDVIQEIQTEKEPKKKRKSRSKSPDRKDGDKEEKNKEKKRDKKKRSKSRSRSSRSRSKSNTRKRRHDSDSD